MHPFHEVSKTSASQNCMFFFPRKKKTSILLGLVAKHEVQPSIEKSNLTVDLLVALKVVLPAQRKRFQKETDCKTNLSNPKSTSDVKF